MESFKRYIEPFVVRGEASEAGCPGEVSFHHPVARYEHEASFRNKMLRVMQIRIRIFDKHPGAPCAFQISDSSLLRRPLYPPCRRTG